MQNYFRAYNEYRLFCLHAGFSALPVTETNLIFFCTHLSQRIAHNSIKCQLSGISYHCSMLGYQFDTTNMVRLHYLLRGIKKCCTSSQSRRTRLPITIMHLQTILRFLQRAPLSENDKKLWWSASTLAFFGLLRVSEYTSTWVRRYQPNITLAKSNISFNFNNTIMTVSIKVSKTDVFRAGCRIHIGSTNNMLCPVNAMRLYLASRTIEVGPLYYFSDNSFLTRGRMASFLTQCLRNINLNTHSFRIGGATALAASGVPAATIRVVGRWSSDCYIRYLRFTPPMLSQLSSCMCSAPTSYDPFLP